MRTGDSFDADLDGALDAVMRGDLMPAPTPAQRARESMHFAVSSKPDYEADLQRAARATGVPIPSARSYPDVVTARARSEAYDYDLMAEESPAVTSLLGDVDKARIAHDDVENLSAIERGLNKLKGALQALNPGVDLQEVYGRDVRLRDPSFVPWRDAMPLVEAQRAMRAGWGFIPEGVSAVAGEITLTTVSAAGIECTSLHTYADVEGELVAA